MNSWFGASLLKVATAQVIDDPIAFPATHGHEKGRMKWISGAQFLWRLGMQHVLLVWLEILPLKDC